MTMKIEKEILEACIKIAGEYDGKPYEGYRVVVSSYTNKTDTVPAFARMYKAKGEVGAKAAAIAPGTQVTTRGDKYGQLTYIA